MYVRVATKRHRTYKKDGSLDNTVDGNPDENANVHTFDQVLQLCRIAKSLNIPINPEIMCAYTYMDMDKIQAPRFEEYPEIYALQHGKKWEDLSLNEILVILEKYGEFVADSILATGCTVRNWNLGNEANFGFAGVGMGQPTAVDSKLGNASAMKRYMSAVFSVWWLKKHVWKYEAQTLAAVKKGILKAGGINGHIGFDFACPVNDRFALGFYISGGAGFLREFHPYNAFGQFDRYDSKFIDITVAAGLMMEIGDLNNQPFLVGVCPATGIGFVDMDLVLPIEVRFGRMLPSNWYIMGQISYGISLAAETACIEPSLRVGYNFGKKSKKLKKTNK